MNIPTFVSLYMSLSLITSFMTYIKMIQLKLSTISPKFSYKDCFHFSPFKCPFSLVTVKNNFVRYAHSIFNLYFFLFNLYFSKNLDISFRLILIKFFFTCKHFNSRNLYSSIYNPFEFMFSVCTGTCISLFLLTPCPP